VSCLTVNILTQFLAVNNVLANLYHGEYQKCPPVARMQVCRRLHHWLMPSSIKLCSTPTDTSHVASNHLHPTLLSGRLAATDFVINCSEFRDVRWPEIWKLIWVSLHYCTFGLEVSNDAQNVRVDTARGNDDNQQNVSQRI